MIENPMQTIVNQMTESIQQAATQVVRNYSDGKPVGFKKVAGVDKLYVFEQLNKPENMQMAIELIRKHGVAAFKALQADAEKSALARGVNLNGSNT